MTAPAAPGPALPPKQAPPASSPPPAAAAAAATAAPGPGAPPAASAPSPAVAGPDAGVGEMKPTAAATRRPRVEPSKPSRQPQPGDVICGECGEANASARRFCSRCGASLADAVSARIRWWHRFRRKQAVAGQRPWTAKDGTRKKASRKGLAKILVPLRKYLSIALLVLGLVYGVYSPFRNKVNDTVTSAKNKLMSIIHPKFEPITAGPGTTSNVPDIDKAHPALHAVDGFKNTYWLSPLPTPALQPELDITLTGKSNLDKIIVHNGASDNFQGHARPKTLRFVFDNGQQAEVTLKNTPDPQTLTVSNGHGITRFKIIVTDVYEAIDGKDMALTEVEFFTKK
jgi:hypothetical protein